MITWLWLSYRHDETHVETTPKPMQGTSIRYYNITPTGIPHSDERLVAAGKRLSTEEKLATCSISGLVGTSFMQDYSFRYRNVAPKPPSITSQMDEILAAGKRPTTEEKLATCSRSDNVGGSLRQGSSISYCNIAPRPRITPDTDESLAVEERLTTEEKLAPLNISGHVATSYPSTLPAPVLERRPAQDLKSFNFATAQGFAYNKGSHRRRSLPTRMKVR